MIKRIADCVREAAASLSRFVAANTDKVLHCLMNVLMMLWGAALFGYGWALLICVAASFGKEALDHFLGSGWDWDDIKADAVGVLLAFIPIIILMG